VNFIYSEKGFPTSIPYLTIGWFKKGMSISQKHSSAKFSKKKKKKKKKNNKKIIFLHLKNTI
jgi:hypothetical protein